MDSRFAFVPSSDYLSKSNIARFMRKHGISDYRELVQKSNSDIKWYWDAVNDDLAIEWFQKYDKTFDSSAGIQWTKWFVNGKCNIISNAIDRHAKNQPEKIAYVFEDGDGIARKISYRELHIEVSRLASALKRAGINKGDVVAIYMPTIPEAFFAIFACSKIGAVHTTVFSGYSAQALNSRLKDSGAKMLITADRIRRRSSDMDLKSQWLKGVQGSGVTKIITAGKSDGEKIVSYSEFTEKADASCKTEVMDSEDPLFILYTSGTTGQPKGTLQVHGGFTIVAAQQAAYLIDMKPDDILFWHADIGWITGQTWVVYGSPIIGGTSVVYENALDYPDPDTWCRLIDKHKVTIFGVAPTAIRLFIKNNAPVAGYDFSSLRILATTGEPINSEAWNWYFKNVGRQKCPVINLSGGTEIGGAIVSALPVMPLKPCTVGCQIPGFDADVLDESGRQVREGYLVIKKPWPSMTRGILNDPDRFIEIYWSKYKDIWYHGDIVLVDGEGLWYMRGRADDVIKVAGHRIGTAEIEAAVMSHPSVAEAAAIGRPDDVKGEAIIVCVMLKAGQQPSEILKDEVISKVEEGIGKFARPQEVRFVAELPKTRTGKLVRRLIKAKITGDISGQDLSGVENLASLDDI